MQVTMEPLVLVLVASSLPPSDGHNPNSNSKQRATSLALPSHGNGDVAACCDSDRRCNFLVFDFDGYWRCEVN